MQPRTAIKIADIKHGKERYLREGSFWSVVFGAAAVGIGIVLGALLIAGSGGTILYAAVFLGILGGLVTGWAPIVCLFDKIPRAFIGLGAGSLLGGSLAIGLGFGLAFAPATFGLSLLLGPLLGAVVGLCIGLWRDRVAYKKYKAEAVAEIEAEDKAALVSADVIEQSPAPHLTTGLNPAKQIHPVAENAAPTVSPSESKAAVSVSTSNQSRCWSCFWPTEEAIGVQNTAIASAPSDGYVPMGEP